ncbi:gamma-glutamylcyclotransferase family protein [Marinomonas pollencensis]|uniref:Gamma-glutamylcyclotransferase family protein n=1 Tax=Marinomonas pollencensis TaxID=491954 RepID=A0A3E0DHJ7_9GAMM|nr:gamma-glutamylcyclotransferase family protein [Marinomonas pollencensis]REG82197.1 gamma-glutamylaminecyclotransferase [Marinomonas pollencensis]
MPLSLQSDQPHSHYVFVFGTLKEGFPNFERNQGVRMPGVFKTVEPYPLLLVGERYSPWLVLAAGEGHPVIGQVFCVDDVALAEMDALERITQSDGYRRLEIEVANLDSGLKQTVWVYGKPTASLLTADVRVELEGDYLLEHAALYCHRPHS